MHPLVSFYQFRLSYQNKKMESQIPCLQQSCEALGNFLMQLSQLLILKLFYSKRQIKQCIEK